METTQIGDRVRFSLASVYLPDRRELVSEESELKGTITGFSDSGTTPMAFAVIEISGKRSVVVPTSALSDVEGHEFQGEEPL